MSEKQDRESLDPVKSGRVPRFLRDAWALLGLAFAQMLLTYLFVALLPFAYIFIVSNSNPEIFAHLESISDFAAQNPSQELTRSQVLDAIGPSVRALIQEVPWFLLALISSLVIYPFLGWWVSKLLSHPQLGGLIILGSVLSQRNVVMVPRNIEANGLGLISLKLPVALVLIGLQFILLTSGILAQRGQILLLKEKETNDEL